MNFKKRISVLSGMIVIGIFYIVTIQTVYAESEEKSFSGKISIGGGAVTSKNNGLTAETGGKGSTDLEIWNGTDLPGKKETDFFPTIELELGYTFYNTGTTLFTGGSIMDGGLYLGVHQFLEELGNILIAGSVSEEDVWKDPYLIGTKRTITKKNITGVELGYESILSTGAEISIGMNSIDVKTDDIGIRYQQLRRDGKESEFKLGYLFKINDKHSFKPFVSFIKSDLKGDANSSDGINCGFSHSIASGQLSFNSDVTVAKADFDEIHPIFGKKREEKEYVFSHEITYDEVFGLKGWSVSAFGFYEKTESNINFFDGYTAVGGTKISYNF